MKVFLTGGTGFVGSRLVPYLLAQGHSVVLLVRPQEPLPQVPDGVRCVCGDPCRPGEWQREVAACDVSVNLAGHPIFGRWSPETKALIRDSRVSTTRNLVRAIPPNQPFALVSASAVGVYGNAGERVLDEDAPVGSDFLARVAREWEAEAAQARARGARTLIARFGVVLDRGGGAYRELEKASKRLLGGPVGTGRQWLSWIHREDLVRAIVFLLERPDLEGVFNLCSPNPARQLDVARVVGRILEKPAITPAPAFAVRMVLGEFADVVLFSQRMIPRRLQAAGFSFLYPDLDGAIRAIVEAQSP